MTTRWLSATAMQHALLALASFLAGSINSVAGGGTLLTFPSLLAAHVSSVAANATSTVALVPGSLSAFVGYRARARSTRGDVLWFVGPSLLGGVLGATLLVRGGDQVFSRLVPWLLFAAVLLFVVQEPIRRFHETRAKEARPAAPTRGRRLVTASFQVLIAIYGGYFGAGMGILMLATMGFMGQTDIHQMNRLKNVAAVAINGVASVTFALSGQVRWSFAMIMAVGATMGGYLGAGIAQRIGQVWVRRVIIGVGFAIGVYTLVKPL